jgi:hypothetical protein
MSPGTATASCTGAKSCQGPMICAAGACRIGCTGTQSCPNSVCCWAGSCALQPLTLTCMN